MTPGMHCRWTDLPLNLDDKGGDPQMRASLDRIDSTGQYAAGNLQIVCRFANFWQGKSQDQECQRLVRIVMRAQT